MTRPFLLPKPCRAMCQHTDCAVWRAEGQVLCPYCNQPIGHSREVVRLTDDRLAHWQCERQAVDQSNKERMDAAIQAVLDVARKNRS